MLPEFQRFQPEDVRSDQVSDALSRRCEPSNDQLRAVIGKTLEQAAAAGASNLGANTARKTMAEIAGRHPQAIEISHLPIATEVVIAMGSFALPGPIFRAAIERVGGDIATQILSDPIASRHLQSAWSAGRQAAGLDAV